MYVLTLHSQNVARISNRALAAYVPNTSSFLQDNKPYLNPTDIRLVEEFFILLGKIHMFQLNTICTLHKSAAEM